MRQQEVATLLCHYDNIEPYCRRVAHQILRHWDSGDHENISGVGLYLVRTAMHILDSFAGCEEYLDAEACLAHLPEDEPNVVYLRAVEQHIAGLMDGSVTGSQIVKACGMDVWQRYNRTSLFMGCYPDEAQRVLVPLIMRHGTMHKTRVLEIGGGVGGTTLRLMDALRCTERFVFTDLKPYFGDQIKPLLPRIPLETAVLDINDPASWEALPGDAFDVIYATNVLHCAHNIPEALAAIRQRLASGGALVLAEGSPYSEEEPWPLDLCCALFDGWWQVPTDLDDRPTPGFLTPDQWRRMLARAGFLGVEQHVWGNARRCLGGVYVARKGGA